MSDKTPKRPDSRIEHIAKRVRQRREQAKRARREWKKRPVLKTAAAIERATRRVAGAGRRASVAARRRIYAYGVAYGSGQASNLAKWARQRRQWIAQNVEWDTSGLARVLQPGMSARRRALYAAARTRRASQKARAATSMRMVRTAGQMAVSEHPAVRRVAGHVRRVADRVYPYRYTCPRCRQTVTSRAAMLRHSCIQPHEVVERRVWVPDNPDNPTHALSRNPNRYPIPKTQPAPQHRNRVRNTRPQSATTGGNAMSQSQPATPSGAHPAQLIGRGGVSLAGLTVTTDQELIWTLERMSAACQMVGNGSLSFAEYLDAIGVDPRVIEPLRGFAEHMAEGAAFPLSAHRMFWALYGHRIQPAQGSARTVKSPNFFGDQRAS